MSLPDYLIPDSVFVANVFRKKNGQPYGKRAQHKIRLRLKEDGAIVMIAGCAFVDTRVFERAPPAPPAERAGRAAWHGARRRRLAGKK